MTPSRPKRTRHRQHARVQADRANALPPETLARLEEALGYRFREAQLALTALTHASLGERWGVAATNERLEFLGDRVLGLVMAERLYRTHVGEQEGRLATRFNGLVDREACARAAEAAGIGALLLLDTGEEASGGREKPTVLADAMEALLGAVYLDAGLAEARRVIERLWTPEATAPRAAPARDPKTALQEWLQGQGLPLPRYEVLARTGPDHAPLFVVASFGAGAQAEGTGASKQLAERAAAESLLRTLKGLAAPPPL